MVSFALVRSKPKQTWPPQLRYPPWFNMSLMSAYQAPTSYRNATSGYRGVGWDHKKQKWTVYDTSTGGKGKFGTFVNKDEAIMAAGYIQAHGITPPFPKAFPLVPTYTHDDASTNVPLPSTIPTTVTALSSVAVAPYASTAAPDSWRSNWKKAIRAVLREAPNGELRLREVRRLVLNEYMQFPNAVEDEKARRRFKKRLKNTRGITVTAKIVKLSS